MSLCTPIVVECARVCVCDMAPINCIRLCPSEGLGTGFELNKRVDNLNLNISCCCLGMCNYQMSPAQYNDLLSGQLQFYFAAYLTNFIYGQFVA